MSQNRELTMDDYLAMLRRRMWVILIPTLLAPLVGFAVSYAFTPKYTSTWTVLVEEQKVPEGYVKPVVTEDVNQRLTRLLQRALSAEELRPVIQKLKASDPNARGLSMEQIRAGLAVQAVQQTVANTSHDKGDLPGFNVNFTGDNPQQARAVCIELTNIIIRENFSDREEVARETTDFLGRQVEDAKHRLDDLDTKLASFKGQFMGQLPEDSEKNLQVLMGLNSQLETNSQTLNRAQQDKAYAESLLAQQLAAWKSTASDSADPRTLQKQMADLQSQLLQLKARYTDDYPEVVKAKNDIKALQKKIDEVNAAAANPAAVTETKANLSEPPEIQQLRLQVHQQQDVIAQTTRSQQKLEDQIKIYQGRVTLSPSVDQKYKELTRDYDSAQKTYNELLSKKAQADVQTAMERDQQGEQMQPLAQASLPGTPSFPNRPLFAGGALAGGLVIGLILATWLEFRDQSIRNEADVVALLDLPVLTQIPWLKGEEPAANGNGKPRKREKKETVEV
jgi:polysaccharide chain length determinant protein (PEP-CTERM system associated)